MLSNRDQNGQICLAHSGSDAHPGNGHKQLPRKSVLCSKLPKGYFSVPSRSSR